MIFRDGESEKNSGWKLQEGHQVSALLPFCRHAAKENAISG